MADQSYSADKKAVVAHDIWPIGSDEPNHNRKVFVRAPIVHEDGTMTMRTVWFAGKVDGFAASADVSGSRTLRLSEYEAVLP